jgi:hypothetical protein
MNKSKNRVFFISNNKYNIYNTMTSTTTHDTVKNVLTQPLPNEEDFEDFQYSGISNVVENPDNQKTVYVVLTEDYWGGDGLVEKHGELVRCFSTKTDAQKYAYFVGKKYDRHVLIMEKVVY